MIKMTCHGDDAYKYSDVIDFASNSNPCGASKKAVDAIRNNLDRISMYPDSDCVELCKEFAKYNNVCSENIIAGNGASEVIRLFCEVFLNKSDSVLIPSPVFSGFEANARLFCGEIKYLLLNSCDDFKINADEVLGEINRVKNRIKVVFLCSPNNPSGQFIPKESILKILKEAPETYVFLDESFIEFSEMDSMSSEVEKHGNLFVLRSMTKFFALAGLRVGCGVGNKNLIEILRGAKLEWNVNFPGQVAAVESLKDKEYIENSKFLIKKEKQNLFNGLSLINKLRVYPSYTNFFLVDIEKTGLKSGEMKSMLLKKNILIRDCSNFRGLSENYIRICTRTKKENEKLLDAIKEII
ncbi:MAG: histidinol-phosphate transaminase [Candidatus Altiarchaeales archaeon A3]|nr:MAG: histidinol-phosphate transaminase [Candidatus Altiarchaeales archaeon A3]